MNKEVNKEANERRELLAELERLRNDKNLSQKLLEEKYNKQISEIEQKIIAQDENLRDEFDKAVEATAQNMEFVYINLPLYIRESKYFYQIQEAMNMIITLANYHDSPWVWEASQIC